MKVLLIDGNNFMFAAQHGSKRLTAGDTEVTAVFGFLGSLRNVAEKFPDHQPIILWDSSPSWRMGVYKEYKGNRDKNPQLVKAKEALRHQRPIVKDLLRDMGVRQYAIPNQEADDLAAYLSRVISNKGGSVVLVTRDGDWQQLVKQGVVWYDHQKDRIINHKNFYPETGYMDTSRFVQAKAIHGDGSDNIPGVGGLGEGAAKVIFADFDDFRVMAACWPVFKDTIGKGHPWSRYKKKVQAALDDPKIWNKFTINMHLMDLRSIEYQGSQFQHDSRYNESGLKTHLGKLGFHSILHKYDRWLEPFNKGIVR